MTAQPPLRQYSPDGKFWWDGTRWQPVVPAPPPPGVQYRKPTRIPPALVLAGASLLGALLGGGVGAAGASVSGGHPHGPSAPPAFAEGFPNGSQRYLPGVTVSSISDDWLVKLNKWTCAPTDVSTPPQSGAKERMDCTASGDAKYDLEVDIEYDDGTHVRMVRARCEYGPGSKGCRSLFANLADAVLASQAGERRKAQDWGAKNTDADSSTVIGGVQLLASLDPHSLSCTPAA
jgi:hypothetical protein